MATCRLPNGSGKVTIWLLRKSLQGRSHNVVHCGHSHALWGEFSFLGGRIPLFLFDHEENKIYFGRSDELRFPFHFVKLESAYCSEFRSPSHFPSRSYTQPPPHGKLVIPISPPGSHAPPFCALRMRIWGSRCPYVFPMMVLLGGVRCFYFGGEVLYRTVRP